MNDKNNHVIDELLYEGSQSIDRDQDYWFPLRGDNDNLLIDVATPLFGLALRVKGLSECPEISDIYNQVVKEVTVIEIELSEQGYEHAVIMAYRYILCAFLDESVMSTSWGGSSVWAQNSVLSRFHDETWGGEKVFSILSRIENDTVRYKELLSFILQCLTLGFEGKYKVITNGHVEREKLIARLYENLNSDSADIHSLSTATDHVVHSKYKLGRQMPVWSVFVLFFISLSVIFSGYFYVLHSKSLDVLSQLNQLL